jgi:glutamyl-tRNA(Gln) amidotransferase subunit D
VVKINSKQGDIIEIKKDKKTIIGTYIRSSKEDTITIKLKSGYNLSIKKKNIQSLKILKNKKDKKNSVLNLKYNKKLPIISILHTGGTIASKVDYSTGGVYSSFEPKQILNTTPELKKIANIQSVFISNIMSEDIRFKDYKKIINAIKQELKTKTKGIIVSHGTDTLSLTATALSFAFENPQIPIILVGSQRSSDRGSSDSTMNLVCAAEFITKTDFKGVAICMHKSMSDDICSILPATKTKKMHTSRRDAFKVINGKEIANINYKTKKVNFTTKLKQNKESIIKDKFEDKIAIIKTYPNMYPDLINTLIEKKYKGLILESSGIGQAPTNTKENLPNYNALKKFINSGGFVILTSNCIFGRVHPHIYTNCRRLEDIGIIFGEDMLTETAFIKLAWLLGNYKKSEVKELITKNLRGEISKRTKIEEEFLN